MEQFEQHHQSSMARLAGAGSLLKANLLSLVADRLECNSASLMVASGQDLQSARAAGLDEKERARLLVSATDIRETCAGLRQAAEALSRQTGEDGMTSTPEGAVLLMGSTSPLAQGQAAALCLAAGRTCILSGDRLAANSQAFIGGVIRGVLHDLELPEQALLWLDGLSDLEDEAFAAVNRQLGLVVWLGQEAPDSGLMDRISLPFVQIAKAHEVTALLKEERQG